MAARSQLSRASTTSENKATVGRARPIGMGLIIIIFESWRCRLRACRSGTSHRVADVERAARKHILAEASLVGLYER